MILTARQAEKALVRLGPEERRRVIEVFSECRDVAAWEARVYEQDAEAEVVTLDVLWSRLWLRFWRFFERRHASHIKWVESLEANEQGGNA